MALESTCLCSKMQRSWEGPYWIVKKVNEMVYSNGMENWFCALKAVGSIQRQKKQKPRIASDEDRRKPEEFMGVYGGIEKARFGK